MHNGDPCIGREQDITNCKGKTDRHTHIQNALWLEHDSFKTLMIMIMFLMSPVVSSQYSIADTEKEGSGVELLIG